jgi:hypothetical protein
MCGAQVSVPLWALVHIPVLVTLTTAAFTPRVCQLLSLYQHQQPCWSKACSELHMQQCWLRHDDTVALHFVALFQQQLLPSVKMGMQTPESYT